MHSPFHYAYYAVWVVMIGITFWVSAWEGELVLPLDDVYIHFQYAKQLVAGQPYQYNPGLAPSHWGNQFALSPTFGSWLCAWLDRHLSQGIGPLLGVGWHST
ncbi:MAG UNVERIFIED_CONTAM: hypothetical protein LVT10_12320 [Anaerolineae bacterium]